MASLVACGGALSRVLCQRAALHDAGLTACPSHRMLRPFIDQQKLSPSLPLPRRQSTRAPRPASVAAAAAAMEALENNPGLCEPDPATAQFIMQQTMYRIKDPKASLEFYSKVLGMRLLKRLDYPEMKFSLYFMGYEDAASIPDEPKERLRWMFMQKGTLELTHNWGTESDPEFKGYHNGNSDPRGWGHIGITVPDVYEACARFETLGVSFVKRPDDGKMKGLAFIKDPDGYWIEILSANQMTQIAQGAS